MGRPTGQADRPEPDPPTFRVRWFRPDFDLNLLEAISVPVKFVLSSCRVPNCYPYEYVFRNISIR